MNLNKFLHQWFGPSESIRVQTSGSTGEPKEIRLKKEKMRASAQMTCQFLGLHAHDTALLCLPLDYIAGKMMVVRAVTCNLQLISVPPTSCPLQKIAEKPGKIGDIDFVAMVPMQVYNSLQHPEQREILKRIRHLIIGGSALDPALEEELKSFPNAVWSTYGMTETISHIALRRVNGKEASLWYKPFEGVDVSLNGEQCLVINAPYISSEPIVTNDIAETDAEGNSFRILGRRDNVICSGGLKLQIEAIEDLLQPSMNGLFAVVGCPHPVLGECVVLLTTNPQLESVKLLCETTLPRYWRPRKYIYVETIPLTPTGKIARQEAKALALERMSEK